MTYRMREKNWYKQNRWRLEHQLPERRNGLLPTLEELKETEWNPRFDILAKGKMVQAAFRYGLLRNNNHYDFLQAMKNKIALYEKTHNLELMVDVRNYAMLEFTKPQFSDAYYENEDDTEHAPLKNRIEAKDL